MTATVYALMGIYVGHVLGSHFFCLDPVDLLKKGKAYENLGGWQDGLMVSSSVLVLDPTAKLPCPVPSRRTLP